MLNRFESLFPADMLPAQAPLFGGCPQVEALSVPIMAQLKARFEPDMRQAVQDAAGLESLSETERLVTLFQQAIAVGKPIMQPLAGVTDIAGVYAMGITVATLVFANMRRLRANITPEQLDLVVEASTRVCESLMRLDKDTASRVEAILGVFNPAWKDTTPALAHLRDTTRPNGFRLEAAGIDVTPEAAIKLTFTLSRNVVRPGYCPIGRHH